MSTVLVFGTYIGDRSSEVRIHQHSDFFGGVLPSLKPIGRSSRVVAVLTFVLLSD